MLARLYNTVSNIVELKWIKRDCALANSFEVAIILILKLTDESEQNS